MSPDAYFVYLLGPTLGTDTVLSALDAPPLATSTTFISRTPLRDPDSSTGARPSPCFLNMATA